jgi:sulfatase maturation enzyme AslB (radical SAM superfamily)
METAAESDTYCAAPFRHMVARSKGKIAPCCLWLDQPGDSSKPKAWSADPFNSAWMENIRSSMLANERLAGCNECYMREKSGVSSYRNAFNREFGRPTDANLEYIEYNLGNLCNLKCRMCSSWNSSKWAADEIALGIKPTDLVRPEIGILSPYVDKLKKIRFIGGEPSLEQDAIFDILKQIQLATGTMSHLHIILTTNCMVILEPRLLEILSQCCRVEMQCSIDGYGAINDYQRTGAEWQQLIENLTWYQAHLSPVFDLMILTSWSLINAGSAIDFLTFVHDVLPRFFVWGHLVRDPEFLDIRNLPMDIKSIIRARLDQWSLLDDLHWIRHNKQVIASQLMLESQQSPAEVLAKLEELDRLRDEDFARICPEEHAALLSAC